MKWIRQLFCRHSKHRFFDGYTHGGRVAHYKCMACGHDKIEVRQ